MEKRITSVNNEQVKYWKKLLTAKGRKKEKAYIVETWHLVEEALTFASVRYCMLTEEMVRLYANKITCDYYVITEEIAKQIAQTQTPQPIFAVVAIEETQIDFSKGKYILLDALQDPGNVGTIIRTADAVGFSGVILGDGTVDCYNDKVLRAMQGSQYHLPVCRMNLQEAIQHFQTNHIVIYGTELNAEAVSLCDVPYTENCALILGNEGSGVSPELLKKTDKNVYIKMPGKAESLNVAVAAGLMMYHFVER